MVRGLRISCIVAIVSVLGAMPAVRAAELVVDPWKTPKLAERLCNEPKLLRRFSGLTMVVFSNGQLAGPSSCPPFAESLAVRSRARVVELTRLCRDRKVRVRWALDLLRWRRHGCADPGLDTSVLARCEWDQWGLVGGPAELSWYASPWDAQVRDTLRQLAETVAQWEPQPDAICLTCRLSAATRLGYRQCAREAAILACGVDPIDLDPSRGGPKVAVWGSWREAALTGLVGDFVELYRTKQARMTFSAWSTGAYPLLSESLRANCADNGLDWYRRGWIDAVFFDGSWTRSASATRWLDVRTALAAAVSLATADTAAAAEANVHPLLYSRDRDGQLTLVDQVANLRAQGVGPGQLAVCPLTDADFDVVLTHVVEG